MTDAQTFQEAVAFLKQNRLAEARARCSALLLRNPGNAQVLELMAVVLLSARDYAGARHVLEQRLKQHKVPASVFLNLGVALKGLGQPRAAAEAYAKAARLDPGNAAIFFNLGNALAEAGDVALAVPQFRKAIALRPALAEAHGNLGNALAALGQHEEALAAYDAALALKPDVAETHSNRALALEQLKRFEDAMQSHGRAMALAPQSATARNLAGNTLAALERVEEALACYSAAIALAPNHADAWQNRGLLLSRIKQPEQAFADFDRAVALGSRSDYLLSRRLHEKMRICHWHNHAAEVAEMCARLAAGEKVALPFAVLGLVDDPKLQKQSAEIYAADMFPSVRPALQPPAPPSKDGRITIGYFSADFHDHPMLFLMAEVFELHDRSRFRIVGFSFGPPKESKARERVLPHFDAFHDVREMSDADVMALARREGVDIAIDRKGYTEHNRTALFARGLAPVQVNYLAYPGTLGASFLDYLVADPVTAPPADHAHFTEKIASLPHCYQPNDRKREIAAKDFSRAELGLPEQGFVFACFNNTWKITPDVFALWMRILARAPGAVLWLFEENAAASANLRKAASAHGIDPARLVFATRMALPLHLARHRAADLFLDTLPYNAHTTASDALWTGLPVLTRRGKSFTARVAASLVQAAGLPELIVETEADYEALALRLFGDAALLASFKARLAANRLTCPLFDSAVYVRGLESLYTQMMERQRAGLPPAALSASA